MEIKFAERTVIASCQPTQATFSREFAQRRRIGDPSTFQVSTLWEKAHALFADRVEKAKAATPSMSVESWRRAFLLAGSLHRYIHRF